MKPVESSVTLNCVDKIKSICSPLFEKGVKHFTHDITFTNGQLSELTSEPGVYETWSTKRPSAVFVNESGRALPSGIYLNDVLSSQDDYYRNGLSDIFFPIIGCNKLLEIVERDDDCQHMFHLGFNYDGNDYHQWLLNNIDFFRSFINSYKRRAKPLIDEVKKPENRIVLPIRSEYNAKQFANILFNNSTSIDYVNPINSVDSNNSVNSMNYKQKAFIITLSHHETFEPITLPSQQSICLTHLMNGRSAKVIAAKMELSSRTVEHYLAKIKKRLGCNSTIDLISKYSGQFLSYHS